MSNNSNAYFDLHTTGFGYLNRVRKVVPKRGNPFYAVTIACLRGDDNEKTYIDCKVVCKEAMALFEQHQLDKIKFGQGQSTGSLSFVIGDLYLDTFTYPSNHASKPGQTGAALKGRLLRVKYLKVNQQVLFQSSNCEQQAA